MKRYTKTMSGWLAVLTVFAAATFAEINGNQTDTDKTITKLLADANHESSRVQSNIDVVKRRMLEVAKRLQEIPQEIESKRERVGQRLFEAASKMGENSDEYRQLAETIGRQLEFEINALNEEKSLLLNEQSTLKNRLHSLEKKHAVVAIKEEMHKTTESPKKTTWNKVARNTLDHYRASRAAELMEFVPARQSIATMNRRITPDEMTFIERLESGIWK